MFVLTRPVRTLAVTGVALLALAAGCTKKEDKPAAAASPHGVAAAGVSVRVLLAPDLAAKAKPDDTVYIIARLAEGTAMPLAVVRKQVKDLPAELRLDDSHSMNAEHKLSGASSVVITARVSRSGEAMPQSGDLEGSTAPIKLPLDQTVVVAISRQI